MTERIERRVYEFRQSVGGGNTIKQPEEGVGRIINDPGDEFHGFLEMRLRLKNDTWVTRMFPMHMILQVHMKDLDDVTQVRAQHIAAQPPPVLPPPPPNKRGRSPKTVAPSET